MVSAASWLRTSLNIFDPFPSFPILRNSGSEGNPHGGTSRATAADDAWPSPWSPRVEVGFPSYVPYVPSSWLDWIKPWWSQFLDVLGMVITCHSIGISMGPDVWNPMVSRTPEARATGQSVCLGNIKNMRILAQKEGTTMRAECWRLFLVFRLADVLVGWANNHVHHSELVGRKAGGSSQLHQRGLPGYLDPGILATEWSLFRAKQYGFQQKELEELDVYIRKAPMGSNHFMEFCMIWAFPLDAWCYTWIQMFQMILFLWS